MNNPQEKRTTGEVIAFIGAPGVGTSFLTKQMACRHCRPGFFEGEDGIFTSSVVAVLNSEEDTPERWHWITNRTRLMLERAHKIAESGITSYVDGDLLLAEAWLAAEIGSESPPYLRKWIENHKHLGAHKVIALTASEDMIAKNRQKRGRASEQTDFISERATRIGNACVALAAERAHGHVLDRTTMEFTDTSALEHIDQIIESINPLQNV